VVRILYIYYNNGIMKKIINEEKMKAICFHSPNNIELKTVSIPQKVEAEHMLIEMLASGINPGDNIIITGIMPSSSHHGICGVSGVGKVIEIGEDTPQEFKGKNGVSILICIILIVLSFQIMLM